MHYDLYVNLSEAVLGESKNIDTVSGKVKIKIEPGTQSGKILRLRGKGLPSIDNYHWDFEVFKTLAPRIT